MSPEGVAGGLQGDSGHSDMGHTTMVPGTPGAANRLPNSATKRRITSEGPIQQGSSPIGDKTAAVSHLEGLRKSHVAEGISGRASELLLSGWSKGTNATYQLGWNSWCDEREIDPISCDMRCFLDFLAELFEQGMQHRSINTIRSAVSMTHNQVQGIPISQHPFFTRLLKGVYV